MRLVKLFVALVVLGVGTMLLAKAWQHWQQSNELLAGSETAQGTIERMAPFMTSKVGSSSSLVWFPVVTFTTAQGKQVTFQSQVSRRADHYKAGDPVIVLYPPERPQEAVIGGFSALWSLVLILGAGGSLIVLLGAWFLRRALA